MAKDNAVPGPESAETSVPIPVKEPFAVADYSLVDLESQGDEIYVPLLSRSYSRNELLIPAVAETLHLLGWPHIKKN